MLRTAIVRGAPSVLMVAYYQLADRRTFDHNDSPLAAPLPPSLPDSPASLCLRSAVPLPRNFRRSS